MGALSRIIHSKDFWKNSGLCFIGCLIFAGSFNLFIVPQDLYSGNFTGIAQIFQTLLRKTVDLPPSTDLTGAFLFLLNIPLLILAYLKISKTFFFKTIFSVVLQTAMISVIPIPPAPWVSDPLTSCLIGGLIGGVGCGTVLRSGSSGGGTDIVGMYCTKHFPDFSVGKISMGIGALVFLYCIFNYDFEHVIYSIIYTVVLTTILDQTHYQNIKTSAIIFTKNPAVEVGILKDLRRGTTRWSGEGGYTHETSYVFLTVISKYEMPRLRRLVHKADPHAFIIFHDVMAVDGNFEKRL